MRMKRKQDAVRLPVWILWTFLTLWICLQLVRGDETSTAEPEGWNVINGTIKRNYNITGIPQIDYVHDPNLPRELNGYNLSTYPFFNRVPKNINFKCDGLKDGFYASVEHGCQLYHHCLFGTRYDFLCANYTAFDQRTFICQFVSEVDCPNSALFFHRNDALYLTPTTTTVAPVVIYVGPNGRRIRPAPFVPPPEEPTPQKYPDEASNAKDDGDIRDFPPPRARDRGFPRRQNRRRCGPGRRRRCRRPRPDYYDYYDYDDYYENERRPKPKARDQEYEYEDYEGEMTTKDDKFGEKRRNKLRDREEPRSGSSTQPSTSASKGKGINTPPVSTATPAPAVELSLDPASIATNREKIFSKSRAPPKIRPPVPLHEKRKYNGIQGRVEASSPPTKTTITTIKAPMKPPPSSSMIPEYEDYYEDELIPTTYRNVPTPATTAKPTTVATTTTTTPPPSSVEPQQYEYEYEDYEEEATTTLKPVPVVTAPAKNFGPRRFHQQRPEESIIEETLRAPGNEHQKINEALETPSRASFRIPYHNKPRPAFLRNTQMLLPITTLRTTTITGKSTSSERPTTPFLPPLDQGIQRFPVFDTTPRLPLEPTRGTTERRVQPSRQRGMTMETTTPEAQSEEYEDEILESDEVTERYGRHHLQNDAPSMRSFQIPEAKTYLTARHHDPSPSPLPQQSQQRMRPFSVDAARGTLGLQTYSPTPTNRPEFISLLSEDEDAGMGQYFRQNQPQLPSRFTHTLHGRTLMTAAAQEMYPTYVANPYSTPLVDQYINSKTLRRQSALQPAYPQVQPSRFSYPAFRG